MASSAKQFSFFLLLITLLSSLHTSLARDSQFFNKIPSTTNKNVVVSNTKEDSPNNIPQQDQQQDNPNFLPENENSYGLYGHESGQIPPSTTTTTADGKPTTAAANQPLHKYLPKNYNPVAYVTQPEDINDSSATLAEENSYTTNPDNLIHNNNNNYYNGQQEDEETEYRSYPTTTTTTATAATNSNNKNYYNGGSSFNSQPQGMGSDATFRGGAAVSSEADGFQPQGLSDTRSLENGKYYYDVSTEKYSTNHPYESLRGSVRPRNDQYYYNNNRNYNYGNNVGEFSNENTMGGYQNREDQFQYEEENNMP